MQWWKHGLVGVALGVSLLSISGTAGAQQKAPETPKSQPAPAKPVLIMCHELPKTVPAAGQKTVTECFRSDGVLCTVVESASWGALDCSPFSLIQELQEPPSDTPRSSQ